MAGKRKFSFRRVVAGIGWLLVFKVVFVVAIAMLTAISIFVMVSLMGKSPGEARLLTLAALMPFARILAFLPLIALIVCRRMGVLPGLRKEDEVADLRAVFSDDANRPAQPLNTDPLNVRPVVPAKPRFGRPRSTPLDPTQRAVPPVIAGPELQALRQQGQITDDQFASQTIRGLRQRA